MVRLFVAIDLPDDVKERLAGIQEDLSRCEARITPVDPQIVHLTLKFIGEVPEERVGEVKEALSRVKCSPFTIRVRGIGGNNPRQPRVIWCRVEDEGCCEILHRSVEEALSPLGIPREARPFRPHATVARVKEFHPSILSRVRPHQDADLGSCRITGFTLKKSTLTPRGPVYEDIMEVAF
jgi:2'-5' RNA ligase